MDIARELFARHRRKGSPLWRAAAETARGCARVRLAEARHRILRHELWQPLAGGRVAIFAHYESPIEETRHYLTALREVCASIIFVSTREDFDLRAIRDLAEIGIVRSNIGYDFGSWKIGLEAAGEASDGGVVFVNDSVWGPNRRLAPLFERMDGAPLWGMVESREIAPHLQSWFLVAAPQVTRLPWFRSFWRSVRLLPNEVKFLIVRLYEVGFSQTALAHGLTPRAAFETASAGALNPAMEFWRELVAEREFPFLKRGMSRPENRDRFRTHDLEDFRRTHFPSRNELP